MILFLLWHPQVGLYPDRAEQHVVVSCIYTIRKTSRQVAIFYRAVRNLVDFSLVTKLTKHVSKVRKTVRNCEKIRQNDCKTFFMTSDSQKMTSRFSDSYFCTKFRISQPGWYPDRAIKIRQVWELFDFGCETTFKFWHCEMCCSFVPSGFYFPSAWSHNVHIFAGVKHWELIPCFPA